jgi:hypothetical protein
VSVDWCFKAAARYMQQARSVLLDVRRWQVAPIAWKPLLKCFVFAFLCCCAALCAVVAAAGADRLTAREAELCASARLLPIHYISLKDVMMRDAQVHGHISRFDVSAAAAGWRRARRSQGWGDGGRGGGGGVLLGVVVVLF